MYYHEHWNVITKKLNRLGVTTFLMLNCGTLLLRYSSSAVLRTCKFGTSLTEGLVQFVNDSALVH